MTPHFSWQQARAAAQGAGWPLDPVTVPVGDAIGCALAGPLCALTPVPPFDTAAMDGYVVAGQPPWRLVGRVLAGDPAARPLGPGEALEIATGAPVPADAVAVVPYERASRVGDQLTGDVEQQRPGRHIRRAGEECAGGAELLPSGSVVTPAAAGLAASTGHDVLQVHRRPRVAIFVTGEEVTRAGLPGEGRVRDAVGPFLPHLVTWAGGDPLPVRQLGDDPAALAGAIAEAAGRADVTVVCGASSAGPADHLRTVVRRLDARVVVDGVDCRPGHPQLLVTWDSGHRLVGLPGNPFAALVAALTLLAPLLAALSGRPAEPLARVRLCAGVAPHPRDTRIVAVSCRGDAAFPVGHDSPALLWGAARADGLAAVPPRSATATGEEPGELSVEVMPLPR